MPPKGGSERSELTPCRFNTNKDLLERGKEGEWREEKGREKMVEGEERYGGEGERQRKGIVREEGAKSDGVREGEETAMIAEKKKLSMMPFTMLLSHTPFS